MSAVLEKRDDSLRTQVGVNNFSIVAATVNGSGSQTANSVITRALFKMGIPTSGKNLFPSNISGLPTWYIIRLSSEGFIARRETSEILVAMNRATANDDIAKVPAGGVVIYPTEWKIPETRSDVTYYSLPVLQLAKSSGLTAKLLTYAANMVYVGALAELLGIEIAEIENALLHHFNGKRKPVESNMAVVTAAAEFVRANIVKKDTFRVERMNMTKDMIQIDGNTASALGAIFGGVTFVAWYPITPSTSLVEELTHYAKELRMEPETKKATFAVVQAEDEIAAIGMLVGAGWAGARALTATSGPGIALMTEYAGYAYFTDIPLVVWDVTRMGPSTGMPTRVSQGDILTVYYLGHGDTRHIILLPANMEECFEFGWKSFDLAERLQTPVFVLSDLDLGMNTWMSNQFQYPDKPMDRGKVLSAEQLNELKSFNRYDDSADKDGVGPRTLPGTDSPYAAYFTRGSGHNSKAMNTEKPDEWEDNLKRLARKHEFARTIVPSPVIDSVDGAEVGIIAYGSTDAAIAEARYRLNAIGLKTSYARLKALPATQEVLDFMRAYKRLYVVESNFDGQMAKVLMTDAPDCATRIVSVSKCDGWSLTSEWIAASIWEKEQQ